MFAQAMSSTSTTALNSIQSVGPMLPTTCSCAGTSDTPQPAFESGLLARDIAGDSVHLRARLIDRDASRQPADRLVHAMRPRGERVRSSVSGDHTSTSGSPAGS